MKIKQRPEDFVVREGYRFESAAEGPVWVYRMDKQKVTTLDALERISKQFSVRRRNLSVCGLKDKQGRTEQLVGVEGGALGPGDVVQAGDLRLQLLGRTAEPLGAHNITANRFEVTIRDLSPADAARAAESVAEVQRVGVVNYFDSQRFGFLKHGQGFIAKSLLRGDWEGALKAYMGTPSALDHSDDAKVKKFWADNWGQWQMRAPQGAGAKYAPLLRRLREDPKDFKGAFLHIDRRMRMMVLFEFQSYVWNEGVKRYLGALIPRAEIIGLRYQAGALQFPRALAAPLRDELWKRTFPLLAPDSKFKDEQIRAAAIGALRSQGLALEQLVVPDTKGVFFKHEERPLFVMPGKLRVNEPRQDELNRNRVKINLSFTLPPGAYASLVVRRVFWFAVEGAREGTSEPVAARPTGRRRGTGAEPQRAPKPAALVAPAGAPVAAEPEHPGDAPPASAPVEAPRGFRAKAKARKEARSLQRAAAAAAPAPARKDARRAGKKRPAPGRKQR